MTLDLDKAMKELGSKGIKIPPQPKVLLDLRELLANNDFGVRKLTRIILGDPGIAALLFKAAGSPVFHRGKKFSSLEQVVMVVGAKQTFNLVQAIALSSAVPGRRRKALDIFWARSQDVAQLAATIAEDRVSVCNIFPDQAYLAGMFLECGVPILMQRFPDYCDALHLENSSCWPDLADEDVRFDVDHCSIGYLVAKHWNLPDFVCAAIQYHHEMPSEELGATSTLVAILQLAIHFYQRVSGVENPLWPRIRVPVMAELGLHIDFEQEYFEEISERFLEGR
ncbi:MAG TPA: HDOD domain-containing protein [Rhodocyclaceae bacterium]|nr:HDOD domain-containing protein [Rhodocyclaceae bacterium]